jgi:hypothetical protein
MQFVYIFSKVINLATDIKMTTIYFEFTHEIQKELDMLNITSDKLISIQIFEGTSSNSLLSTYRRSRNWAYIIYKV